MNLLQRDVIRVTNRRVLPVKHDLRNTRQMERRASDMGLSEIAFMLLA
jgi:hypothetical protein